MSILQNSPTISRDEYGILSGNDPMQSHWQWHILVVSLMPQRNNLMLFYNTYTQNIDQNQSNEHVSTAIF